MFAGEESGADGAVEEGEAPAAAAADDDDDEAQQEEAVAEPEEPVSEPEVPLTEVELARKSKLEEIERLRAKEKFITAATGALTCRQAGGGVAWTLGSYTGAAVVDFDWFGLLG